MQEMMPPAQKIIPPYRYYFFEKCLFFSGISCMMLCIPFAILLILVRANSLFFLVIVVFGTGIILLAIAVAISELHFRRDARVASAIVTRELRLIENYFAGKRVNRYYSEPVQKLATFEAQFITQSGDFVTLELLAGASRPEIGQMVNLRYLSTQPQVAALASSSIVPVAIFYCLVGLGCIVFGVSLASH